MTHREVIDQLIYGGEAKMDPVPLCIGYMFRKIIRSGYSLSPIKIERTITYEINEKQQAENV
jgi:hypothetical protein